MKIKNRILVLTLIALLGLVLIAAEALMRMKGELLSERRSQIARNLDFVDSQLRYFYSLEMRGVMSRQEAQERAKESIAAQRKGSDYFFIRNLANDYFVYHPDEKRMGRPDQGELTGW